MKKYLFLAIITCLALGCSSDGKVYLCNGPYSEVYHNRKRCDGLRKCSTDLEKIDIELAKERGRRACGYCY